MKKFQLLLFLPVLSLSACLLYLNLPGKRYARHLIKARLLAKENNLAAAQIEYERAYGAREGFTPYVSLEVAELLAKISLQNRRPGEALAIAGKYAQTHPQDIAGHLFQAELAFGAGDLERAFASLDILLAAPQGEFPARLLLARIRTSQARLDLAAEQLRVLFSAYPDSVDALLPWAGTWLPLSQDGLVAESRAFLRQVLAGDPKRDSVLLMLVDSYVRERRPDSAQALLDRRQGASDPHFVPDRAPEVAVRLARIRALTGRLAEAKAIVAPFVRPRLGNADAMACLAVLHAAAGEYDSTFAMYDNLVELRPESKTPTDRLRTLLHLANQNPARALETSKLAQVDTDESEENKKSKSGDRVRLILAAYLAIGQDNKAADLIQAQPDSLRAGLAADLAQWVADKVYLGQWAMVEYFQAVGEDFLALQASETFHRAWPANAFASRMYAANLEASGDYAGAAALLGSARPPELPGNRILIGLARDPGQKAKAKSLAEKCLQADPARSGLNAILAELAWSAGDQEAGLRFWERELALHPDDAESMVRLAWEYGAVRRDSAQAEPYVAKLREHKNKDPRILDALGWILFRNGRAGEGEGYLRQAVNQAPDRPGFLYHLGAVLAGTGRASEAKDRINKALAGDRPFAERKDAEALLARP